jgi:hypothetical protein
MMMMMMMMIPGFYYDQSSVLAAVNSMTARLLTDCDSTHSAIDRLRSRLQHPARSL